MTHVILSRPLHPDRRADLAAQQRRLGDEVALGLAPETTAQEGDVDPDLVFTQSKRLGNVLAHPVGALDRGPDFAAL